VIIPQMYDQYYFAKRIEHLGIGTAHPPVVPTTDSLTEALSRALQPDVAVRGKPVADAVRTDGAKVAAQRLISGNTQSVGGRIAYDGRGCGPRTLARASVTGRVSQPG